jgi:stage III sporulation protein AF
MVQNLIVIAVLAVFLEMLLPASPLRSYVKMVMGLLIIVAVLQTAGNVISGDWLAGLPEFSVPENKAGTGMDEIIEDGKKLTEINTARAVEEYRRGLSRQISALAGLDGNIAVLGADVVVQEDSSAQDFGQVKEVTLLVGSQNAASKGDIVVQPVEPVTVGPSAPAGAADGGVPSELSPSVEKLSSTVANFYNLPPERVKVIYRNNEGGKG